MNESAPGEEYAKNTCRTERSALARLRGRFLQCHPADVRNLYVGIIPPSRGYDIHYGPIISDHRITAITGERTITESDPG